MAHSKLSLFFLLVLITLSSSKLITQALEEIDVETVSTAVPLTFVHTMNRLDFFHEGGMPKRSRKLLEDGLVQPDYNFAGANPRHDPRRGRGGRKL